MKAKAKILASCLVISGLISPVSMIRPAYAMPTVSENRVSKNQDVELGKEFWRAIHGGNIQRVEEILGKGVIDLNEPIPGEPFFNEFTDYMALNEAAKTGNCKMAKLLLDRGANINGADEYGDTPLHCAVKKNKRKMTELLLGYGANINSKGGYDATPLFCAAENNNHEMVKLLSRHGADFNCIITNCFSPLHRAVDSGNYKMLYYLLVWKKLNINHLIRMMSGKTYTALYMAVRNGNEKVIRFLLNHGANPDLGDLKPMDYILDKLKDLPSNHKSIKKINRIIKLLVENGADVNRHDSDGNTLLHWELLQGNEDMVKYLVEHSADSNHINSEGKSVLQWKVLQGDEDMVKYLVDHDADVNCKDNDGNTPLRDAIIYEKDDIMRFLVEHGADPNLECKGGTSIDIARKQGRPQIAEYLVEAAARKKASGRAS